jgi:polyisoprenoid-binding protein YceI
VKKILSLCAAALSSVGAADAATVRYEALVPQTGTYWSTADGSAAPLALSRFDAGLGTLNSVTLYFSGELSTRFKGSNDGAQAALLTGSYTVDPTDSTYRSHIGFTIDAVGISNDVDLLSSFNQQIAAKSSFDFKVGVVNGNELAVLGDLSAFIGTQPFDVVAEADSYVDSSFSGGDTRFIARTTGAASVAVVYDYAATTVPEPGAMALTALALLGLALVRRRA